MSQPVVSVIMSVYNGAAFLREAMDSIAVQTFPAWEMVVIDDGSVDDSGSILDEYAARDARFRVIRRPNKGLTASLNEACQLARGEFFARMDADDVCLPERFERQVAFLQAHPEHDAVGCWTSVIDQHGRGQATTEYPTDHVAIDARLMDGATAIAHPTVMMRRCAVEAVGGYCEAYRTSQDLDLFLRLAEQGQLANLERALLKYRWHDANVSVSKADQQDRDVTAIMRAARQRRGLSALRGTPLVRWQFRRQLALKYALAGDSRVAVRMAWGAFRLRPLKPRSWLTLLGVIVSPGLLAKLNARRRASLRKQDAPTRGPEAVKPIP